MAKPIDKKYFENQLLVYHTKMMVIINNITSNISNHLSDLNNPHQVTKSQVGLENVDDTADVDKPVSTKQQAAIDAAREALQTQIATNKSNLDNLTTEVNSYGFTVADGKLCLIYNK